MQGSVAGTPGTLPTNWIESLAGLNRSITGVGVQDGVNYNDIRLWGTASGTGCTIQFENTTQIVASPGQEWVSSVFIRQVGGNRTNVTNVQHRVFERTSTGAFIASTDSDITAFLDGVSLSSSRRVLSRTIAVGAARVTNGITVNFPVGAEIDITLRIGLPELSLGTISPISPPIPTFGTALTRSADNLSMTDLSWYSASGGVLYVDGVTYSATSNRGFVALNDGGIQNEVFIYTTPSGSASNLVTTSGVAQANSFVSNAVVVGSRVKNAVRFRLNNVRASAGGVLGNFDDSATMPNITRMNIGSRGDFGFPLNGLIREIAFIPDTSIPDSALQRMTR
jgi:hypothetical protein